MKGYRWTARVGLAGLGVLALWAVFVAVVRVLDVPVRGDSARGLCADGHDDGSHHPGGCVARDACDRWS